MTLEKKNDQNLNFSTAKSIMAALWHLKSAGRENLFSHKYLKLLCKDKSKITYRSSISRLNKQKLIKKEYNDVIALTELGEKEALFAFIEAELALHKKGNATWDKGWRIVFFDIPEGKRKYRDYLRKVLKTIGFHEFQRSIWAYPYPVPPFLKELIFEENIKSHVRFITANYVDDDSKLKKVFDLA